MQAQAMAGPQSLFTTCQQLTDARQAFQTRGPANHSSIGMHSRTPSKDTGVSNSRLQGLCLGKGSSSIYYAPHLQSDVASVPATPRACLTSPATQQGSSSKSTRLPVRKGLPGYKNCSGSVRRELMSETPQLNGKRPQSDISDSKTVNMAMQATDSSLKLPNAQFNRLDRPDFESVNDIQCLPEPHHAQASALCAKCDAKCLQCRFIPETEGVDCGSVQTIFSLQLPEGDVTLSGDHGADSKKEAPAARYCVQDSDLETEGGDCSSVQTTFSLQLPEGDITPSGDHGADSNEEALAASYCVQNSDHELKIEGGDCDSVQTIFSLQLPEGDITASCDHGADSNKEALASSYCVQDSDHELDTEEGDCGRVKMDFSISLSKRDVSPRGDYGDDSNEDVLAASYFVQDPNHELETEGGDCGNVKTIFRLSLSEGDISQRGDHGANSKKDDLAASFCVKDSDNELETDGGDCVNVKTGFSLSLSEEDISGRCDHGTDSKKAALAASYCVPDLNHELETEGGDGSNVRTIFQLTFSEDDISPRGDYGTDSNKEILTAGDCVQDSDCELSGGQSNSCGAVLVLPISLSSGNIASSQNCGSEQVETSGSSDHALQKQALAWMARSDCLQSSESIQSVLLLSPHDNLLEAPTEPGSGSAVEARESSPLQVSMKTTDLSELLEFSAIILCTQISGDDKEETEETEVTSLPSGMTPVIASSLESTPQAGCDQCQKLDCQQLCFAASESIPTLPAAGICFNDTRCVHYEQSNSLSSKDFGEAAPKQWTPPVTKEIFCQKFGIKHSWQYNSPTSKGFSEASATPNSLPAPNRYAQNSGYKKHWHPSLPGIGAGVPPTITTLTPVSGRYGSLLGCNDPADATVTSSPIEANSGLLLLFEQHRDAHTAINATGSSNSSPKNAERKTVDSPLSQWSDWPILGASIADDLKQSDDTTLLKYQALRPSTEQERGLICDRSPLENDSLIRMPARKAVPVETDGTSDWSPLAGPNVSNACSLNIKEKGSLLLYARKAVSQLTSSPMSANAGGQENFGTLISCKSQQSRTPGKTCLADSKPPSPFSEERICALEAAGKVSFLQCLFSIPTLER